MLYMRYGRFNFAHLMGAVAVLAERDFKYTYDSCGARVVLLLMAGL